MALDLPPPITPVEGPVQPGDAVATVPFQDYSIQVSGSKVLGQEALTAAVTGIDSLSNAVRAMASAYYAAGYPAAQLTYSLSDKTLYVLVTLGGVSAVDAPAEVKDYLAPVVGVIPLTDSSLEPRRILASVKADRAGLDLDESISSDGTLHVTPGKDQVDPTQVRVEVGNPGNRFVGRYFIDVDLKTADHWGDDFRALARSGTHAIGSDDGEYFEQNLSWSRVTTWGIFGAGGRYVDFTYSDGALVPAQNPVNGAIWLGEAYWLYPILADFDSRLVVQAKVDRTSKTSTGANDSALQHELYNSVEGSASYSWSFPFLGSSWDLDAALAVRKGITSKDAFEGPGVTSEVKQDYLLYRPGLRLRDNLTERFAIALELSGQITSDALPEQQQWVLGGRGNLSSSLPGIAVGDQGYLARLVGEAGSYDVFGVTLTPKVFIESGSTTFKAVSAGGTPSLTDVGGELGFKLLDWLEGSLVYAKSVTDSDITSAEKDKSDANLFFTLQAKF